MEQHQESKPLVDLSTVVLHNGAHKDDSVGTGCLLEVVALFAGEPMTDHPKCVCPVLRSFGILFNDRIDDESRQMLIPLIPTLINTVKSVELQKRRALLLLDRGIRKIFPAFLRGMPGSPDAIANRESWAVMVDSLDPIVDTRTARAAQKVCGEVKAAAYAAYAAYADSADSADYAASADYADYAASAASADYADYAASADYADYAASAASADYADYAAKYKALRSQIIAMGIEAFKDAIALTE